MRRRIICIITVFAVLAAVFSVLTVREHGHEWFVYRSLPEEVHVSLGFTAEDVQSLSLSTEQVREKFFTEKTDYQKAIEVIEESVVLGRRIFPARDDMDGGLSCSFDFILQSGDRLRIEAEPYYVEESHPEYPVFLFRMYVNGEKTGDYNDVYFFHGNTADVFWELYDRAP